MLGKLDSIPSLCVTRALCETYDTVEWMTHNVFWTPTLLYNVDGQEATFQEASTKKPLLDHQRSQWLLGTGFLTNVKMSSGFFVILFWLLGQKASKKPL